MGMKRDINSKRDAITKDVVPNDEVEQVFSFPTLGVSVKAKSMNEALTKAKAIRSNKK